MYSFSASSQHKRRQVKKSSPEKLRIDANLKPNGEDAEFGNASINGVSSSKQGSMPKNGVDNSVVNKLDNESNSLSLLDDKVLMLPPPRDNSLTITQLDSSSMQHNDDINADPKSLVSLVSC